MEPKYQLNVIEFGKIVRSVGDEDKDRFLRMTSSVINEHLDRYTFKDGIVKNLKFELFTNH